eukprot:scaffold586_cov68-Cylindrotheca_fusiformis.AAC.17
MVFLTISKKITSAVGPALFRSGLTMRNAILRGSNKAKKMIDIGSSSSSSSTQHYYLDMAFLIPYSQKLISLAIYDESQKAVSKVYYKDKDNNGSKDTMLQALSLFSSSNTTNDDDDDDDRLSISDLRIQVYNDKIRPALLPNERWSNVNRWRWNNRIVKWARTEFLISKHGPSVKVRTWDLEYTYVGTKIHSSPEALDAYPQLRASPQFTRHPTHNMLLNLARGRLVWGSDGKNDGGGTKKRGTMLLPSSETLIKAFRMRNWAKEKNSQKYAQQNEYISLTGAHSGHLLSSNSLFLFSSSSITRLKQSMMHIVKSLGGTVAQDNVDDDSDEHEKMKRRAMVVVPDIPEDVDLSLTPMEDILEIVTGGHVKSCGPFNAICEEANMYQMWTKEYVQHLGDYLLQQQQNSSKTMTILDVGAGDGLLLHYLRNYMESKLGRNKQKNIPAMIATDDGSWGIFAKADVEKLNVQKTLEKYCPLGMDQRVVILCSWMPQMVDWTALFRQAGVDEYIMIGEADDGSCGHLWETWGNPMFAPSEGSSSESPPFETDGYRRWDMDVLSQFQFSRFDCALSRSSKTVSFRRTRAAERKVNS